MNSGKHILLIVRTDVAPEMEEEFNRWYDEEHHHRSLGYVTPTQWQAGMHMTVLGERASVKARCLAERRVYNTQNPTAISAAEATSVA